MKNLSQLKKKITARTLRCRTRPQAFVPTDMSHDGSELASGGLNCHSNIGHRFSHLAESGPHWAESSLNYINELSLSSRGIWLPTPCSSQPSFFLMQLGLWSAQSVSPSAHHGSPLALLDPHLFTIVPKLGNTTPQGLKVTRYPMISSRISIASYK